jgi:hypothetical protein
MLLLFKIYNNFKEHDKILLQISVYEIYEELCFIL